MANDVKEGDEESIASSLGNMSDDEPICVIAPFALPGNYTFEAIVDGNLVRVVVPPDGCAEGEVIELPSTAMLSKIPTISEASRLEKRKKGKKEWDHGLFSCFNICFSSLFWMALCFPYIVLGQLMQRIKLNSCGVRDNGNYRNFTCIFVFLLVVLLHMVVPAVSLYFYSITENGEYCRFVTMVCVSI